MFSLERKSSSCYRHSVTADNKDSRNNSRVVYILVSSIQCCLTWLCWLCFFFRGQSKPTTPCRASVVLHGGTCVRLAVFSWGKTPHWKLPPLITYWAALKLTRAVQLEALFFFFFFFCAVKFCATILYNSAEKFLVIHCSHLTCPPCSLWNTPQPSWMKEAVQT